MLRKQNLLLKQALTTFLLQGLVFVSINCSGQSAGCSDTLKTIEYSSQVFSSKSGSGLGATTLPSNDNGKIIFFNNEDSTGNLYSLLIFKIDSVGKTVWAKKFKSDFGGHLLSYFYGYVMSSGNIILAGYDTAAMSSMCLLVLDKNGNLVWQKLYNNIAPGPINEGQNGEILVSVGELLQMHLDASGNVLNNDAYHISLPNNSTTNLIGSFMYNNSLFFCFYYQYFVLFSSPKFGVSLLQVDYKTGAIKNFASYDFNHSSSLYCDSLVNYSVEYASFFLTKEQQLGLSFCLAQSATCKALDFLNIRLDMGLNILPNKTTENSSDNFQYRDGFNISQNSNGDCAYFIKPYSTPLNYYYAIISSSGQITVQRRLELPDNGTISKIIDFKGYSTIGNLVTEYNPLYNLQFFETSTNDFVSMADCASTDTNFLASTPLLPTKADHL